MKIPEKNKENEHLLEKGVGLLEKGAVFRIAVEFEFEVKEIL